MREASRILLLSLLASTVVAAGCLKDPPPQFKGVEAVPSDAPSEVGKGNFRLVVQMVAEHEGGAPIANAPLLIYPIEKPFTPPSIHQLRSTNASYMARSDERGQVVAHLIEGHTYSFQSRADGFTREFRHLKTMDRHLPNPMPFVLYQANKTVEITGKVFTTPNKVDKLPRTTAVPIYIGGSNGIAITWLKNITFHPLEGAHYNREYVSRLSDTKFTLTWVNNPPSFADLGVRAGFQGQNEFWWEMDAETDVSGPAREELTVKERSFEFPASKRDPKLMAGAITRMPVHAPDGIEWKLVIEATFSTEPVSNPPRFCNDYATCVYEPGFEAAFGAVAVLGAAWFVRRRLA